MATLLISVFVCAFLLWRAIAWVHARDIARLKREDIVVLYRLAMRWGWRNVTYSASILLEIVLCITVLMITALLVLDVVEINWNNLPIVSISSLVAWIVNLGLFAWALSQSGHQSLNDDGYSQDTSYTRRNENIRLVAFIVCVVMCCLSLGVAILSTILLVALKGL